MQKKALPVAVVAALCSGSAMAELSVNGFATAGVAKVSGDDRRYGASGEYVDDWRAASVSRAGLQAGYQLTDRLSATAQVLASGERSSFDADVEWAYLSYQLTDRIEVRAGQLRTPVFLLSESLDVGYSYPWISLPEEVYGQVPISSYQGGDLLYSFNLGGYDSTLQVMVGQTDSDIYQSGQKTELSARDIWGVNLTVHGDYGRVRFGHVAATVGVDTNFNTTVQVAPGVFVTGNARRDFGVVIEGLDASFTSLGYAWERDNWVSYAEVARRDVDGAGIASNDSAFASVGYRFGNLMPHLTYAWYKDDGADGEQQDSWTLGVRYDIQPGIALKAEYQTLDAEKSGAFEADPANRDADAEIYRLAVDFVF